MPAAVIANSGLPALPFTFRSTQPPPVLHYQGAEALLYKSHFLTVDHNLPCALKHRPSKPYRHAILDAKLTRHRILAEARVLVKLRREGVAVPAVYALDWEQGWMLAEWIDGGTIRSILDVWLPRFVAQGDQSREGEIAGLWTLMHKIGRAVGRMHEVGVVHGDLTTSNLMLRPALERDDHVIGSSNSQASTAFDGNVVLIDFGLAQQSVQDEDRAVDLYVLERAFGSTHPKTEGLFAEVLKGYGESYKTAKVALRRLEEVRMRGRKKIMIG